MSAQTQTTDTITQSYSDTGSMSQTDRDKIVAGCLQSFQEASRITRLNQQKQMDYDVSIHEWIINKNREEDKYQRAENDAALLRQQCYAGLQGNVTGGLLGNIITAGFGTEVNTCDQIRNTYTKKDYQRPVAPIYLPLPTIICSACQNQLNIQNNTQLSTGDINQVMSCLTSIQTSSGDISKQVTNAIPSDDSIKAEQELLKQQYANLQAELRKIRDTPTTTSSSTDMTIIIGTIGMFALILFVIIYIK